MNYFEWFLPVVSAGGVVMCALSFTPRFQGFETRRIARLAGIGFPPEMEPSLRGRATRRLRWASIGGVIGLLVGYLLSRQLGPDLSIAALRDCVSALAVGAGVGTTTASLTSQLRPLDSSIRLARPRVVTVSDYVAPSVRVLGWITWALSSGFVLFGLVLPALNGRSSTLTALIPSIIVLALSGCGLVLFEVSARIIVRRGQPASSRDDLLWDDAQRSFALRDILESFLPATIFSSLTVLDVLRVQTPNSNFTWVPALIIALWGVYFALSVLLRNTRTWYLERLWPGGLPPAEEDELHPVPTESTRS